MLIILCILALLLTKTLIMKTTIYNDTMTSGNSVKVEINRYAKGYNPISQNGYTHEYELLVNGAVEMTFRDTLQGAKKRGYKTLVQRWASKNRD
jgi:hypothetical protein